MPPLTRVQDVLVNGDATFEHNIQLVNGDATFEHNIQVKGDTATGTITIGHTTLTEDQLKKLLSLVE